MAPQKPPQSIPLGGLCTRGNPLARPPQSSIRCRNFRIMPGITPVSQYLRLRGGKTFRKSTPSGSYRKFYEWSSQTGGTRDIALYLTDAGVYSWRNMGLTTTPFTDSNIFTVSGAVAGAIVGVRDRVFFAGSGGSRSGGVSTPPLRSWDGTTVRMVGIDAYVPGGANPVASLTIDAGLNQILTSVDIWLGLFNTTTQHYSNAVFCGRISVVASGTIHITNLSRLSTVYNNATEQGELKFVVYASVDGGQTAYLVLNTGLTGPYTSSITSTDISLSLTNIAQQGFVLDFTQERPVENTPPRAPIYLTYANGRVYGAFGLGAVGSASPALLPGPNSTYYPDFDYPMGSNGSGFVGWSATADDRADADFVGIPEESWPTRNRKYTPNGKLPWIVDDVPGTSMAVVLTNTSTYLLYEAADGLHQWITVDAENGVAGTGATYTRTPRGPMWITQQNQLVLLNKDTLKLEYLSLDFDEYLGAPTYGSGGGTCADYIKDPYQQLDYYEVFKGTSSVVYDFAAGGQAVQKTASLAAISAGSVHDSSGRLHHIVAYPDGSVVDQETVASTGQIPTRDEMTSGVYTELAGDYITQWMPFNDPRTHKFISDIDVIGDGELSAYLNGRPISVSCWIDFDDGVEINLSIDKTPQSQAEQDHNYKARIRALGNFFWIKLRIQLAGHGSEQTTYSEGASSTGEVPPNFYGCIYNVATTVTDPNNRP